MHKYLITWATTSEDMPLDNAHTAIIDSDNTESALRVAILNPKVSLVHDMMYESSMGSHKEYYMDQLHEYDFEELHIQFDALELGQYDSDYPEHIKFVQEHEHILYKILLKLQGEFFNIQEI